MKTGMPYLYSLATQYAYASNYKAIRHPSLPNYLAIAGGSTFNVTDDSAPSAHPINSPSIFGQAISAGKTAKTYAETMPSNCALSSSGAYAVKHNPWAYFTPERSQCAAFDVPSGTPTSGQLNTDIANGALPNAGFVIPNLKNDAHDGSLATADTWLKGWLPKIMAGKDYQSGHLVIIVTADEDDSSQSNTVLTTVIAPQFDGAHKVVTSALTHYSLTGFYEDVEGAATKLNGAATAPSFASAFGLKPTP